MKKLAPLFVFFLLFVTDVFAGPGGAIAKGLFNTFWGKLFLILLILILLPYILYSNLRGRIKSNKTVRALNQVAADNRLFDPVRLNSRMREIFERVYFAWNKGELDDTSEWMNSWYRQNQQIVHLNYWKENGLKNHCQISKINSIRPIHIQMNQEGDTPNGSRIVFRINAEVQDYLEEIATGRLVKGERGFVDHINVWTLELVDGVWKLDNIEEVGVINTYERMRNVVVPSSQMNRNPRSEGSVVKH